MLCIVPLRPRVAGTAAPLLSLYYLLGWRQLQARRPIYSYLSQLEIPFLTACLVTWVGAMQAYSGTGDKGETSLYGGTRVEKADPRGGAYGALAEVNSGSGVGRAQASWET